ncbi:MAG: hypothetical protein OXB95_04720 [Rhodobacteraceae bacterium]|nr:hypothetical protein [Paracoccaceae bacterium]
MRIEAQVAGTGKKFVGEAPGLDEPGALDLLKSIALSEEELLQQIDQLQLSADAKRMLYTVARTTIWAGKVVIRIGRKILETVMWLVRSFTNAPAGLIVGSVLGILVSSIPILGFTLGPFMTPLLVALGLAIGAVQDIKDKPLKAGIDSQVKQYENLRTT